MYGHAKQGASFGHTKIAGKQVLRKGLSPFASTDRPVTARLAVRRVRDLTKLRPWPATVNCIHRDADILTLGGNSRPPGSC